MEIKDIEFLDIIYQEMGLNNFDSSKRDKFGLLIERYKSRECKPSIPNQVNLDGLKQWVAGAGRTLEVVRDAVDKMIKEKES